MDVLFNTLISQKPIKKVKKSGTNKTDLQAVSGYTKKNGKKVKAYVRKKIKL